MKKLKAGLVGAGYWGKNVIRTLQRSEYFNLVGICDTNQVNLGNPLFSEFCTFNSVTQMFDEQDIDILFVTTNQSSHFDLSIEALKRNIHVFVSKPLATNTEEAKLLIGEAEKRGLLIHEDLTWLYNDTVRELKRFLNSTDAKISFIKSIRANTGPIRLDLSVLWDLAPHDVSISNYLLESTPIKVSAIPGANLFGGSCNVAFISLLYPDETLVSIELNSLSTVKSRQITVQTSKGQVIVDNDIKVVDMTVCEKTEEHLPGLSLQLKASEPRFLRYTEEEALLTECKEIANAISSNAETLSSGRHIVTMTNICEKLEHSLRRQGEWQIVD